MVRLVFRPYTQVRRTICTSVSLRASTRVSPGFALPRHSSPSFGSQHTCSVSIVSSCVGRWCYPLRVVGGCPTCLTKTLCGSHFPCAQSLFPGVGLARMLDSLVRVPRRDRCRHSVTRRSPRPHTPKPRAIIRPQRWRRVSYLPAPCVVRTPETSR